MYFYSIHTNLVYVGNYFIILRKSICIAVSLVPYSAHNISCLFYCLFILLTGYAGFSDTMLSMFGVLLSKKHISIDNMFLQNCINLTSSFLE